MKTSLLATVAVATLAFGVPARAADTTITVIVKDLGIQVPELGAGVAGSPRRPIGNLLPN